MVAFKQQVSLILLECFKNICLSELWDKISWVVNYYTCLSSLTRWQKLCVIVFCSLFFLFVVCVLQILVSHLEHDGRNFVIVGVESGLHSGQVFAQNCP